MCVVELLFRYAAIFPCDKPGLTKKSARARAQSRYFRLAGFF